jgi:hypothetical protein
MVSVVIVAFGDETESWSEAVLHGESVESLALP